jgi:hypothetical protein
VLAGVGNSTALFEEVTRHRDLIVAHLDGAYDQTGAHDLGRATWPLRRERLRDRRQQVVADLTGALHASNAVTGLDEVWQLGREPVREVDGRLDELG